MKRVLTFLCPCLAVLALACGPTHVIVQTPPPPPPPAPAPPPPPAAPPPAPEITYQTFYDALSPYGQWVDYPGSGYVWIPDAGPDFKPYSSGGHWVYSDEGWTWVSDYPWGWATFHYGRWFSDDNYGWCWVPGYQWAPAWVSWRKSPDYYGWAPLAPTVGVRISISAYNPPAHVWSFVPQQYVTSPRINNYYVAETQNVTIINRTTVINNYITVNKVVNNTTINNTTINNVHNTTNVYVTGPDRAEVEAVTHTTIRPVTFKESNTPGGSQVNNGQLTIYRPPVRTAPAAGNGERMPAPARVTPLNTVRHVTPPATPQAQSTGVPVSRPAGDNPQQGAAQQQAEQQAAAQKAAQTAAQQTAAQQKAAQQKAAQQKLQHNKKNNRRPPADSSYHRPA